MKIRISDISPKGLEVTGELPLESLKNRMKEGENQDILFLAPPIVSLTVTGNSSGAELKGSIKTIYTQPCSLCLEGKTQHETIPVSLYLKERPAGSGSDDTDDIGIVFFEGDNVELTTILEEEIIVRLSLFWHPPFDTSERCLECKKTRKDLGLSSVPDKATLGDLLRKA